MNKKVLTSLVIVLVVALCGIGGYVFYDKFFTSDNRDDINVEIVKDDENEGTKDTVKNINYEEIENKLTDNVLIGLYNYIEGNNKNFKEYLQNLDNNKKLYLGGFFDIIIENRSYKKIEDNLISLFGDNIGLEAMDYYTNNKDSEPQYLYNKNTGMYEFNKNSSAGDVTTDFLDGSIYNYKLKDIVIDEDKLELTYYGLFIDNILNIGPNTVTNNKNIDRLLGEDSYNDNISDEYYFEEAFRKNKNDFFQFKYTFEKKGNNYILVDFAKIA